MSIESEKKKRKKTLSNIANKYMVLLNSIFITIVLAIIILNLLGLNISELARTISIIILILYSIFAILIYKNRL